MNKSEVIALVAEKSGIDSQTCKAVIDALEKVLSSELEKSGDVSSALGKIAKVLDLFKR